MGGRCAGTRVGPGGPQQSGQKASTGTRVLEAAADAVEGEGSLSKRSLGTPVSADPRRELPPPGSSRLVLPTLCRPSSCLPSSLPTSCVTVKSPGRGGVIYSAPRVKTGCPDGIQKRLCECRFLGLIQTPYSGWGCPRSLHFNPRWFIFSLKLEGPRLGFRRSQLPLLSMGTRSLKIQETWEAAHSLAMGRRRHPATRPPQMEPPV